MEHGAWSMEHGVSTGYENDIDNIKILIMKKIILITGICTLMVSAAHGQTEDASSILERSRELTVVDAMEATITLTITDQNGNSRIRTNSMVSKKYPDGTEKRLIRFLAPAEVKGTAILIHDYKDNQDDMWIYLPALKRVRRIITTEKGKSFMGSEFSNADISSPPFADFINRHLAGSGKDGMFIIESIPADASKVNDYGYSRRVSYFHKESLHLSRMEFYDRNNILFKTIKVSAIEPLGSDGTYIVKSMTATNHQSGRSSTMKMDGISSAVRPADAIFDAQNLDRQN
jgi:hypothetical protein